METITMCGTRKVARVWLKLFIALKCGFLLACVDLISRNEIQQTQLLHWFVSFKILPITHILNFLVLKRASAIIPKFSKFESLTGIDKMAHTYSLEQQVGRLIDFWVPSNACVVKLQILIHSDFNSHSLHLADDTVSSILTMIHYDLTIFSRVIIKRILRHSLVFSDFKYSRYP